jgi:hypothetical protein
MSEIGKPLREWDVRETPIPQRQPQVQPVEPKKIEKERELEKVGV